MEKFYKELEEKYGFGVDQYKLCYIDNGTAYFTTQSLDKQWGDDWDDAPYEHNAEDPYSPSRPDLEDRAKQFPNDWNEDGSPKWVIFKIKFDGDFEEPNAWHSNSRWSVKDINEKKTPWLVGAKYSRLKISIFAGATIKEFIKEVISNEGEIFLPIFLNEEIKTIKETPVPFYVKIPKTDKNITLNIELED